MRRLICAICCYKSLKTVFLSRSPIYHERLESKMQNLIFVKYDITQTELIFAQFRQKHLQFACRHTKIYPASDRFLYHTT